MADREQEEPTWLYPVRLVLRVRGPLPRRRLDREAVAAGLGRLLDRPVALPERGAVVLDHIGPADWRARTTVTTARGAVREVRVVVGAPWSDPRPKRTVGVETRSLLGGVLDLAETLGAAVDVVQAVPPELDLPRPSGRLRRDGLDEALRLVGL